MLQLWDLADPVVGVVQVVQNFSTFEKEADLYFDLFDLCHCLCCLNLDIHHLSKILIAEVSYAIFRYMAFGQSKYSPFSVYIHLVTAGHSRKSGSCYYLCLE